VHRSAGKEVCTVWVGRLVQAEEQMGPSQKS